MTMFRTLDIAELGKALSQRIEHRAWPLIRNYPDARMVHRGSPRQRIRFITSRVRVDDRTHPNTANGSIASTWRCQSYFRFSPDSRRSSEGSAGPKSPSSKSLPTHLKYSQRNDASG